MAFKDDRLTLWIVASAVGALSREIYGYIIVGIGIAKLNIVNLSADLFSNNKAQIRSALGFINGTLVDFTISSALGVVIGLLLQWSGTRNYLLKGLGVGMLAWVCLFGFLIHGAPQMFALAPKDLTTPLFSLVGHSIFAGMTSFLIVRWTRVES